MVVMELDFFGTEMSNTVYRHPSHSLKRLRSVQKGTLFKTLNSENVTTHCVSETEDPKTHTLLSWTHQ